MGVYAVNVDTTKGWHDFDQIEGLGALAIQDTETDPSVLSFAKNGIDTCGEGSSIRVINNDGTVTCETGSGGDGVGISSCRVNFERDKGFSNKGWSEYSSGDVECTGWTTIGAFKNGAYPLARVCIQCK